MNKISKIFRVTLFVIIVLLLIACTLAVLYGAFITGITAWYLGSRLFSGLIFIGIIGFAVLSGGFFVALWEVATGVEQDEKY